MTTRARSSNGGEYGLIPTLFSYEVLSVRNQLKKVMDIKTILNVLCSSIEASFLQEQSYFPLSDNNLLFDAPSIFQLLISHQEKELRLYHHAFTEDWKTEDLHLFGKELLHRAWQHYTHDPYTLGLMLVGVGFTSTDVRVGTRMLARIQQALKVYVLGGGLSQLRLNIYKGGDEDVNHLTLVEQQVSDVDNLDISTISFAGLTPLEFT